MVFFTSSQRNYTFYFFLKALDLVEDLVRQSQQILLTLAVGTPAGDTPVRLNPSTTADWQIIRTDRNY